MARPVTFALSAYLYALAIVPSGARASTVTVAPASWEMPSVTITADHAHLALTVAAVESIAGNCLKADILCVSTFIIGRKKYGKLRKCSHMRASEA